MNLFYMDVYCNNYFTKFSFYWLHLHLIITPLEYRESAVQNIPISCTPYDVIWHTKSMKSYEVCWTSKCMCKKKDVLIVLQLIIITCVMQLIVSCRLFSWIINCTPGHSFHFLSGWLGCRCCVWRASVCRCISRWKLAAHLGFSWCNYSQ